MRRRAEAAESSRDEWKRQAGDNWELYQSEKRRAEELKSATADRKEAAGERMTGEALLVEQIKWDRQYLNEMSTELKKCQGEKLGWALKGGGIGFGFGQVARPFGR
jgi:hypothetical protein